MKSVSRLFLPISLALLASSCQNKKVICTEELRSITVRVVDSSQVPVHLDSTITRAASGNIIMKHSRTSGAFAPVLYVVVDDSYQKQLAGRTETLRFYGYKDGNKVVDTPFTVSSDNCHIYKVQGPDQIQLP